MKSRTSDDDRTQHRTTESELFQFFINWKLKDSSKTESITDKILIGKDT